jgi:molybdate transport system substrate-binding protein
MTETTLDIFSPGATLEGITALAKPFAAASGITLSIVTDHGHNILSQALAGEADADVVLLNEAMMGKLTEAGLADADIRARIGTVRVGAAVKAGRARPDVSTMEALTRTVLGAGSIVITSAPSGKHMDALFRELGLSDVLETKISRYSSGTEVNEHLLASDAEDEVAFGVVTEIMAFRDKGVDFAGVIPDVVQMAHVYGAALLTRSDKREATQALMDFLGTDAARDAFTPTGVEV